MEKKRGGVRGLGLLYLFMDKIIKLDPRIREGDKEKEVEDDKEKRGRG
jgi:cysteine sulfinate desulfinase/cysteine desulfurase-like protein